MMFLKYIPKKIDNFYMLSKSYFSKSPSYLILFVTAMCNARCKMCFYWKNIDNAQLKEELSLKEYEKISKKFKNLVYISIGGGEPTLRKDLPKIIKSFYDNSGTRYVNIVTNGGLPQQTLDMINDVFKRCPKINVKISISLDGFEDLHDEIRGIKGLFLKSIETYKLLSKIDNESFALNIATTLSKLNKEQIKEFVDYISDGLNINDHTISFVRGDAKDEESKEVTLKEYHDTWNYLLDKQQNQAKGFFKIFNNMVRAMYSINQKTLEEDKMFVSCVAGNKLITLDEKGNVYPCEIISYLNKSRDFKMGSLRDSNYNINKILKNKKSKNIISFIKKSKCHCGFECANLCNIAFSKKNLIKVIVFPKRFIGQ